MTSIRFGSPEQRQWFELVSQAFWDLAERQQKFIWAAWEAGKLPVSWEEALEKSPDLDQDQKLDDPVRDSLEGEWADRRLDVIDGGLRSTPYIDLLTEQPNLIRGLSINIDQVVGLAGRLRIRGTALAQRLDDARPDRQAIVAKHLLRNRSSRRPLDDDDLRKVLTKDPWAAADLLEEPSMKNLRGALSNTLSEDAPIMEELADTVGADRLFYSLYGEEIATVLEPVAGWSTVLATHYARRAHELRLTVRQQSLPR